MACECIDKCDELFEKRGDPTRVGALLSLSGAPPKVIVATYIPDGRRPRGKRATTLAAAFCPFCGKAYEAAAVGGEPGEGR